MFYKKAEKNLTKTSTKPHENLTKYSQNKKTPNNLTKKLTEVSLSHKNLTKN